MRTAAFVFMKLVTEVILRERNHPCRRRRADIPSHPESLQKQFREQFRCQDHRFPDRKHNHIHCKHIFSSQDSFQSVEKKMYLLFLS